MIFVWSIVGADRILKRQKRKTFVGLVCTFYSTLGGMKAVLMTDLFQVNQTTDICTRSQIIINHALLKIICIHWRPNSSRC